MTDRRPSLIDQMALAAALEADLDVSSGDEEDDSSVELIMEDDDLEGPSDHHPRMFFNSNFIEEAVGMEDDDEDEEEVEEIEFEEENALEAGIWRGRRQNGNNGSGMDYDDVASAPSNAGSEELDAFAEHSLVPMGCQGQTSAHTSTLDDSQVSAFNMSSASETWETEEQNADANGRSSSFKQQQLRRSSFQSHQSSDGSFHSAPLRTGQEPVPLSASSGATRRASHSIRRPSIKITVAGGASAVNEDEEIGPNSSPAASSSNVHRFGRLSSLSARRQNLSLQSRSRPSSGTLDHALESLSTHNSNSEWENIAAAVTVVAAGSQATGNSASRHIKFAVDDTVLVLLTLLNVTNMEDPKDTFTVAPVNKHGFPQGEGRTDEEKGGPYTFVLATVKHVHFDEDDRYYTVVRADTGTEQRADSGE